MPVCHPRCPREQPPGHRLDGKLHEGLQECQGLLTPRRFAGIPFGPFIHDGMNAAVAGFTVVFPSICTLSSARLTTALLAVKEIPVSVGISGC